MPQPQMGETEHFWYRLQPEGVYIDFQRANKALGRVAGRLLLSEDNGRTWPHGLDFADAQNLQFSHIFANGNVLFGTRTELFLSRDNLRTCEPITVRDSDGSPYLPHTPQNPDHPGWYFHTLAHVSSWDYHGTELLAWGNYCNVVGGATPVNIYYSADHGETVKIAYAFGQNPYNRDDGSGGGGTTGTPLGNPDNPLIARHMHAVAYHPAEDAFYACTGDHDKPEGFECHWLRGTYAAATDHWDWQCIVSDRMNSRYKAGGINFVDGWIYWISDSNVREPFDRGIFRCRPEDLANPAKHELLYNPGVESGNMIIEGSVILAAHCAPASPMATGIIISTDSGQSFAEYDLKEIGPRSATRMHPMNTDGWFRMDLRAGWIDYADVLFLKPKL